MTKTVKAEGSASEMTSYRETQLGGTLYRITSVYTGEKELGETLEQLAVRRVLKEIQDGSRVVLQK